MADPAEEGDLVGLEAHPRTPAVAEAAAGELPLHLLDLERKAGGESLDDHDEAAAVRLSRGQEAKHGRKSTGGSLEDRLAFTEPEGFALVREVPTSAGQGEIDDLVVGGEGLAGRDRVHLVVDLNARLGLRPAGVDVEQLHRLAPGRGG